ncbi:MAG: phage holin family protein, partial [Rhodococcus sp.]|nr:phage holin family protein [Rhodococcus sp. (in: high G+C Gram-positive bacteria)]
MQSERWTQGPIGNEPEANRASITDLLRQLASESGNLVRQEMNLAKLEIKDTASQFARDGVKLALGAGLAATGGLALTAFLILVIGNILNAAYWAGALIVGVLFLLVGALIARSGINNMKE